MTVIDNLIRKFQAGVDCVDRKFDAATENMEPSVRRATKIMTIAAAVGLFALLAPKTLVVAVSLAAIAGICYVNRDAIITSAETLAMKVRTVLTPKPVHSK